MRATKNVSKKMIINMRASSVPMKDSIGMKPVKIVAAATATDINVDGEEVEVSYLVAEDGTVYGGNSSVVMKVMDDIIDLIDSGEEMSATFKTINTKSGRTAVSVIIS